MDEQQRTIYIEHFYACHRYVHVTIGSSNRALNLNSGRDTRQLRPDAVEVSDMQVLESSTEFEKYGMKVLGWYHSHPRIKPMPSTKDLSTQLQVQGMIPYAIGIIAGIYSTNTNFGAAKKQYARSSDSSRAAISNSYFSFFRALEDEGGKAGVAVNVTIHRRVRKRSFEGHKSLIITRRSPLWPPWIIQGMCRALRSPVPLCLHSLLSLHNMKFIPALEFLKRRQFSHLLLCYQCGTGRKPRVSRPPCSSMPF